MNSGALGGNSTVPALRRTYFLAPPESNLAQFTALSKTLDRRRMLFFERPFAAMLSL
jgi:hypothetical protein